ncbi:glycosyltransferase [Echinicola sp. 20G]|uniref:glycosyltransferase n=1 Tax=Echinicola sp. 20G TaxID=2781961 RepID=UPI0019107683|nr:glycosyltransferase [Echinicola sp. 20G]
MKNRCCCVFNLAAHYREPIYSLMGRELGCHFYFGDKIHTPIKLLEVHTLQGFKGVLENKYFRNFYWQKGIRKVKHLKYDHLILTGEPYNISNWYFLLARKILKKKTYLWSHGFYGDESILKMSIKKVFFNLSNKVFLYGDYSKKLMVDSGIKESKLVPVYNSLDFDNHVEIRSKLKKTNVFYNYFNNSYPVIIYVGRIQKVKKLDLLIEAIKNLKETGNVCNLVLVGKAVDDNSLKNIVEKNKLNDNVWFYGACYDEKVLGELFYNSHVCVSPGNIGLTAIHSLTYGTPVVTHNNFMNQMPEFEAVKDGLNGSFFKENDVLDLSTVIRKWLTINDEERERVRYASYDIIEKKYNPYSQIETIRKALDL